MKLAFYKVDNSLDYERHTFDYAKNNQEILDMLHQLPEDEYRIYDFDDPDRKRGVIDSIDFQEDYNNEIYDGGWWCVVLKDK